MLATAGSHCFYQRIIRSVRRRISKKVPRVNQHDSWCMFFIGKKGMMSPGDDIIVVVIISVG